MENYMEYMVARPKTVADAAKRGCSLGIAIFITAMAFLLSTSKAVFALMLVAAVVMYIVTFAVIWPMGEVEYEYLYCDKAITVDRIISKSRRKTMDVYDMERMEMLCPSQSPRNKAFEHRQMKEKKYCSGVKSEKYKEFILYYAGNQKIVLDLPDNFVKMVQNGAPRKVFLD